MVMNKVTDWSAMWILLPLACWSKTNPMTQRLFTDDTANISPGPDDPSDTGDTSDTSDTSDKRYGYFGQ